MASKGPKRRTAPSPPFRCSSFSLPLQIDIGCEYVKSFVWLVTANISVDSNIVKRPVLDLWHGDMELPSVLIHPCFGRTVLKEMFLSYLRNDVPLDRRSVFFDLPNGSSLCREVEFAMITFELIGLVGNFSGLLTTEVFFCTEVVKAYLGSFPASIGQRAEHISGFIAGQPLIESGLGPPKPANRGRVAVYERSADG